MPLNKLDGLAFGLIAGFGLFALAVSLSHPFIPVWDEGMHQAAARGTYDTPLYPHIYVEHLTLHDPRDYYVSDVWLNKPPAPFWFGAAVMHVLGVTPLALRLGSLLGMLTAAAVIYLLGRVAAGRLFAAAAAVLFVSLPFGWLLVQGLLFGDVTDCTLVGCNALAVALIVASAERQSWRLSLAAGAVVGVGILCKVMLAVTPLGVAVALWLLSLGKVTKGPRLGWLAGMFALAAAISVPWNVYAAHQWPEIYWMHARTWLGHLVDVQGLTANIGNWKRPIDAILNEINIGELRPIPPAVSLLAALWLLVTAVKRRDPATIALATWLWGTWAVLSYSEHKVPATAWGAVPAVMVGLALLFRDGMRNPPLGFAAVAALCTPVVIARWPALSSVRDHLPAKLAETRVWPGLAEGLCLAAPAGLLGATLGRLLRSLPQAPLALGLAPALGMFAVLAQAQQARRGTEEEYASRLWVSHTREVGLAIDQATPKKSVVYLDVERDPPEASELLNQIFWSGRIAYRGAGDLAVARSKGYHPYLVSPASEDFEPVPGVPPHAWLRAYDLERPTASPAPLPEGLLPLKAQLQGLKVLGAAAGPASRWQDRWAFYVSGQPAELHVVFHTAAGKVELRIPTSACLRDAGRLPGAAWFIVPALGPKRGDVTAIEFDRGGAQQLSFSLSVGRRP